MPIYAYNCIDLYGNEFLISEIDFHIRFYFLMFHGFREAKCTHNYEHNAIRQLWQLLQGNQTASGSANSIAAAREEEPTRWQCSFFGRISSRHRSWLWSRKLSDYFCIMSMWSARDPCWSQHWEKLLGKAIHGRVGTFLHIAPNQLRNSNWIEDIGGNNHSSPRVMMGWCVNILNCDFNTICC